MTEKKLQELSESGKYEVKEITVKDGDKIYTAVFKMDFMLIRKAIAALLNMDMEKTGSKKTDVKVDISIDELAAGDKILFQGWVEGDEEIKRKMKLRFSACKKLGKWVSEFSDFDEDDEEEEKKS